MKIRQSHTFLNQILKDVACGGLAPAPMQRPYVWEAEDVEALCHSIVSGYPIGAILTWRPGNAESMEIPVRRLGPIIPEGAPHTLILDGHNRLASAAWIMRQGEQVSDPAEAEARTWMSGRRLIVDVDQERIRFADPEELEDTLWIGVETLMAYHAGPVRTRIIELGRAGRPEADIDRLLVVHERMNHAFMESGLVITAIEDASPQQAKDAFLAICRTGTPMSEEDFDRAMKWHSTDNTPEP